MRAIKQFFERATKISNQQQQQKSIYQAQIFLLSVILCVCS